MGAVWSDQNKFQQWLAVELAAVETLASLRKVAARKDMSVHALLKWYVGQGLRHDLAQLFSDRVLASTAEVLARHLPSEDVPGILDEIQAEAAVRD